MTVFYKKTKTKTKKPILHPTVCPPVPPALVPPPVLFPVNDRGRIWHPNDLVVWMLSRHKLPAFRFRPSQCLIIPIPRWRSIPVCNTALIRRSRPMRVPCAACSGKSVPVAAEPRRMGARPAGFSVALIAARVKDV